MDTKIQNQSILANLGDRFPLSSLAEALNSLQNAGLWGLFVVIVSKLEGPVLQMYWDSFSTV